MSTVPIPFPPAYVTAAMRGTSIGNIPFTEYTPAQWSWHLAANFLSAVLQPSVLKYGHNHLYERMEHTGKLWIQHSQKNFSAHPEIYAHAAALLESMLMRSEPALQRLYKKDVFKISRAVAKGIQAEGNKTSSTWMDDYYEMRHHIENDHATQEKLAHYAQQYPHGWNDRKEHDFQIRNLPWWPLLPQTPVVEKTLNWFDSHQLQSTTVLARSSVGTPGVDHCNEIHGIECAAIEMFQPGSTSIVSPLGTTHEVQYMLNMHYSFETLAGSRLFHLDVTIEPSVSISDDPSLQQLHAMYTVQTIAENVKQWIELPIVQMHFQKSRIEPSFSMNCLLQDPNANACWMDTFQESMTAFMMDELLKKTSLDTNNAM